MALSGSQITRNAPGGAGRPYAGFTAKGAAPVVVAAESPSGGAWYWPERRQTPEQRKAERIRLGILPPEPKKKKAKRAKRVGEVGRFDHITRAQEIAEEVKRLEAEVMAAEQRQADIDALLRLHLLLSAAIARRQQIEEQDIVFMMMILMS